MNLEKNVTTTVEMDPKPRLVQASTIMVGVLIIAIPIIVALLATKPELWQMIKDAKWEIIKGAGIGVSILPVFIFVTIKGGAMWYKKWWSWAAIGVTCVALVGIIMIADPSQAMGGMNGMDAMQGMNGGMYPSY